MIEKSSAIGDALATVVPQLAGPRNVPINKVVVVVPVNISRIRFSLDTLMLLLLPTTKLGQGHLPHGRNYCGT